MKCELLSSLFWPWHLTSCVTTGQLLYLCLSFPSIRWDDINTYLGGLFLKISWAGQWKDLRRVRCLVRAPSVCFLRCLYQFTEIGVDPWHPAQLLLSVSCTCDGTQLSKQNHFTGKVSFHLWSVDILPRPTLRPFIGWVAMAQAFRNSGSLGSFPVSAMQWVNAREMSWLKWSPGRIDHSALQRSHFGNWLEHRMSFPQKFTGVASL